MSLIAEVRRRNVLEVASVRAMAAWLVVLLLAPFVAAHAQDPLGEPNFVAVGDAESVPDGVVTALTKDGSGMMWIGTPAGLIRYDGYRFRRHVHVPGDPHSLGGNFVRALLWSSDDRLWVGTEVDGVTVYDPRTERFTSYAHDPARPDSLSSGAVTAIVEDRDGTLWVATRGGGLNRRARGAHGFERLAHGVPGAPGDDRVQSLALDSHGTLWAGTWSGLDRRVAGGTAFEPVFSDTTSPSLAGKSVWALLETSDGHLWVGTQQGDLAIVDTRTATGRLVDQRASGADASSSIYALAQPGAADVWVARVRGIEIREPTEGRLVRRLMHDPAQPAGLASNEIRALYHDAAGWVWIGGYGGGVQRHDSRNRSLRVRRYDLGHGGVFAEPNVRSVLELADGRIVAGTQAGALVFFDAKLNLIDGFMPDPGAPGALTGGRIPGLAQTSDGTLWVASDSGLFRYDDTSRTFVPYPGGAGRPRRMTTTRGDDLWLATEDGVYRRRAGVDATERLAIEGNVTLGGDVNNVVEAADGTIWIATERGLFTLPPGATQLVPVRAVPGKDLAHPMALGLLIDREQRVWVDTPEGLHRLVRFVDGLAEFEPVSKRLGLEGRPFGANLLQDARGRLWSHVFVWHPDSKDVYELTRSDGVDIGTGWFRAYTATRDGRLLFGGSKGLLVVEPELFEPWAYQPPLVATELKVDGDVRPAGTLTGGLDIAPDERTFSIEFAALDYSAPERIRYSYRLEGFDEDWIDTTASYRVATYNNLWPGSYTLHVRGGNRSGVVSTHELAIPVRVRPALWQTPWFAGFVVLVLIGLVQGAIRLRTARIERQALELQRLVERRTAELRSAKEHAERALDELQGAQRQLVAAEKMASLGGLVAGIAHEVNTPIGIAVTAATHLQESCRQLVKRLDAGQLKASELPTFRDNVNEAMRLILGSLERALTLITSFKKVAVDQSSEHRRRFDLCGFLEEVRTALQPSFKHTPHVLEIDCPDGVEVDTFPGALFQILTNLVNNSLVHAFGDGRAGRMSISATAGDGKLELRYRDDGTGMPEAVARRAFEPFFTTKRGAGGSGLGLHVVYNLVTQMLGGTIDLRSRPGEGCEFVIRVPLRAPESAGSHALRVPA